MATEKRMIPLSKRIVYAGDVFNSLMSEKGWSVTEASDFMKVFRVVDAVEVVHGCNVYDHDTSFECSVCGWGDWDTMTADSCKYNYCPNCGADMRERKDND